MALDIMLSFCQFDAFLTGNNKGGSITVPLTSYLTQSAEKKNLPIVSLLTKNSE
jgi:hypothetical protein